ncbi:MAG TPA: Crp/Fnr family transcriptional regulator [Candidatus Sulfotelmatobacter sp.]|nr:Crp/Fnr family transcriptional regulator [Candidatus Sulfotelmatobacter sp.]
MGQPAVTTFDITAEPKPVRPASNIQGIRERPVSTDAGNALRRRATSVQQFDAFAEIPLADCISIVASAQDRQHPRRHTLFFEGDPVRQVVLLTTGFAKITQLSANGQEVILRLNGPGDVLGGVGRCIDCEHCSTARTVQPTTALVWETAQFDAVCDRFPRLRRNIAHVLERRLNELEVRFREISTEKVSPRLSSQLVRLMTQVGKPIDGQIEIALSRRELAQLTGTTLFTVSRLLCQWESQGIVSARREAVLVRDVAALQQLSRSE